MDEFKMTKEEESIIESAKGVVLGASEKSEIKARVISYMNSNPVGISTSPKTKKVYSVFDFIYNRSTFLVPAIAVVLIVFGLNSNSNPEQFASLDNIENAKMDTIGAEATFSTMAAPAEMQVQLMQVNEIEALPEGSNSRMMKSVPAESAMMMSVTADESTSTATSTSKKTSVGRLKDQIRETYKSFISRFFNKSKKQDKEELKSEDKIDRNDEKKIEEKKEDDKKVSSRGSDSYNDRNEDRNENEREDEDSDDGNSGENLQAVDPLPPVKSTTTPAVSTNITSYTLVQVSSHNSSTDCWSVVSGSVYNLTNWIAKHPGGQSAIKGMCGVDGTAGFLGQHDGDTKAVNTLTSYKIGVLK